MTTSLDTDAPQGARLPTRQERSTKVRRQRVKAAWLFLAPMLIALTLVAGWPLFRTFFLSLTDASLSDLDAANIIGFKTIWSTRMASGLACLPILSGGNRSGIRCIFQSFPFPWK